MCTCLSVLQALERCGRGSLCVALLPSVLAPGFICTYEVLLTGFIVGASSSCRKLY